MLDASNNRAGALPYRRTNDEHDKLPPRDEGRMPDILIAVAILVESVDKERKNY
jgi:hypothetical protein